LSQLFTYRAGHTSNVIHLSPELAKCAPLTIVRGLIIASELDLDFTKALGQIYLVPFGGEAVIIIYG